MLRQRILIAILLLPILIWAILRGGWLFAIVVALALALAGVEYGTLFRHAGLAPALPLLVLGVAGLILARYQLEAGGQGLVLALAAMASMAWHLLSFERGAPNSATDFAVTLSGIAYLGWLGGYLIQLRALPDGQWWVLVALPVVWIGDSAAYFVGSWIGRRRLAPRLSPNKTWEGYLAGIITAAASGAGLAALWSQVVTTAAPLSPQIGLVLGTAVGVISPLGDLGVSMVKRQMQVKDSGRLFPGHGGMLDRFDSWLWAATIGYYVVHWMS